MSCQVTPVLFLEKGRMELFCLIYGPKQVQLNVCLCIIVCGYVKYI